MLTVSDASSKAWSCREHAIARSDIKRRASCANAWAYYYSANVWPAVPQSKSPRWLCRRVTASAFFSDGEQRTSDEDPNGLAQISPASSSPFTILRIEPIGNNSRRIVVAIPIKAPLDALWSVLTDYEHLADFIPGLAVCKIEDRWENGARLFQIGEQNLALGLKFKAKGVINVQELPVEVLSHGICRRIDFEMIEGDFQIFKGTWQMEQESNDGLKSTDEAAVAAEESRGAVLTYILDVQPKIWLPVGLVEGILSKEIQNNLVCIRDEVIRIHTSLPDNLLDGDNNYPLWTYMMQHVLVAKGVWNIVQGLDVRPESVDAESVEDVAGSSSSAVAVLTTPKQVRLGW